MKITIEVPNDWAPRRELMNDLRLLGDDAHRKARGVEEKITVPQGLVPNPAHESSLVWAKRQRVLGDALHAVATEIERA